MKESLKVRTKAQRHNFSLQLYFSSSNQLNMNSQDPSKFAAAAAAEDATIAVDSATEEENNEGVAEESDDDLVFGLFD